MVIEIREYIENGKSCFGKWFNSMDPATAARIDRCIRRLETGNFGAAKALPHGIYELRLNFGPGYRVYYGRDGKILVILLGGGDKQRQSADIAQAVKHWNQYKKAKE